MALIVEQRPEEQLFVEDNPTIYDTPYYTSRFNAANLPLVYKISNTKFPTNTEDTIESILSVSNNGGFAQLVLDAATYTFLAKGTVEVTNTTNYNGVWTIREVVDSNNIVINAPFVATETGNVQNYYNNYSTLVKVYSGLPEYHPLNSIKPMTLITDNPITVTPNSDNEAVIDVSALVKSKLNLNNDYDLNDIDLFNAFYIEYSEQYDESNGTTVSVTTETFATDLISGCDAGAADFITNGDFATDLTDWTNESTGVNWIFDTGAAQASLSVSNTTSKELTQDNLGLTEGVEYDVVFDYDTGGEDVTITVDLGVSTIFQETLNGSGTQTFKSIFDGAGQSILNRIRFKAELLPSSGATIPVRIDNVSIVNALTNPCIAYIFSSHSALQPQSKYGGNMGEYVQNFNGGVFANKWLTLMQEPVLFEGNYFDLSTLIPQAVIQSAIQAGGFFLQIIEFDQNGVVIGENEYPITQNLGDGIYRFRLDDKTFNTDTKKFTAQILRIPVNLLTSGDQGTFNATTDPNGNPPIDWNLEKDARAIINYDTVNTFEGAGSLSFESRSIFNNNFALASQASAQNIEVPYCELLNTGDFNFANDFKVNIKSYISNNPTGGGKGIYVVEGSGMLVNLQYNSFNVRLAWLSGSTIRSLEVASSIDTLNDIEFEFIQGTSVSLTVNATTVQDLVNTTLDNPANVNYVHVIRRAENNDRGFDGYVKDFIYEESAVILRNIAFNQEQGRFAFCTETGINQGELKVWTDQEVQFGGGAWIDTTLI